jgi:DNA-binding response OmpR family regulator
LAVEAAFSDPYDLVLMDMQMPVMDGYSAIKILREKGYQVPIVALTANAMKADVEKALSIGCSAFLGKPFTRKTIFTMLLRFLKRDENAPPSDTEISDDMTLGALKDDPEMLEVVATLVRNLPKRIAEMRAASHDGDARKVELLAHSLRGATANVGLTRISERAGMIERAAKGGVLQTSETELAHLGELVDEAQRMIDAMRQGGVSN